MTPDRFRLPMQRSMHRWLAGLVVGFAVASMPACSRSEEVPLAPTSFTLSSPAFAAGTPLDPRFTCDGAEVSPPLQWSGVPAQAKSLALIVDDPDAPDPAAPQRTWVHWVLYDLPADADGLPEGVSAAQLPAGTRQGRNDWKRSGYGGPCPPTGRHRYFFQLYALDTLLSDLGEPDKARLLTAMEGHVLAQVELIGTYQRNR